jgi:hypothetical protein
MLTQTPLFIGLKHLFTTPPSTENGGYRVFTRTFDETVSS